MANAMMLENPMVIGEYYDDPEPDWTCPHCHTEWYHQYYGWESESKIIHREPQHLGGCYLCALEKRTAKDAVAFALQYHGIAVYDLVERMLDDYNVDGTVYRDHRPMMQLFLAADPELFEQRAEEWAEEQDDDYYDWFLDNQ